jgi:hypothetical protein
MDHLETLRAFRGMTEPEKDQAIDDLIELVGAVDGLLQTQSRLDVQNLQSCLWRKLEESEREEIYAAVLAAKRYTFIETGVTHPNFQELFGLVTTPAQQARVQPARGGVLAHACAARSRRGAAPPPRLERPGGPSSSWNSRRPILGCTPGVRQRN